MNQKTSQAYSSLIGVPYETLDCWGVAREFYRLIFQIELKSYYDTIPNDNGLAADLVTSSQGDFFKVDLPEFGDIMLINLMGLECHIGIFLGKGLFLHTQKETGCMIDRVEKWKHRISGYYRVKGP